MNKCLKVSFASEKFAMDHIKRLQQTSLRKDIPCRAYLCIKCNTWHLTKTSLFISAENDKSKLKIIELEKTIKQQSESILKLSKKVKDQKTHISKFEIQKKKRCDKCVYTRNI